MSAKFTKLEIFNKLVSFDTSEKLDRSLEQTAEIAGVNVELIQHFGDFRNLILWIAY